MKGVRDAVVFTVRTGDRDRYTAALYAPDHKRPALLALAAFSVEISRIPRLVSEPMPGEIRLQWWHDVIASGTTNAGAGNPVAEQLGEAVEQHDLPAAPLLDLLDARLFDLYADPMPVRTDLEGYCGETAAALIQLSALVLDPKNAQAHAEAAGHAGCAEGIARILMSLAFQRGRSQCYVPTEMLAAAGLDAQTFVSDEPAEAHLRAVAAMLALAREHHAAFLAKAPDIPRSLRPAFLPASTIPLTLGAIEAAGVSVFASPPNPMHLRRQLAILRRAVSGW